MNIRGAFLCFGATVDPRVILLGSAAMAFMGEKMKIAETRCRDIAESRARVYGEYFGKGVQYAIPCWSQEAMIAIAQGYQGAHSDRIRQIAACIALGKTYGADGSPGGPKGGQPARIDTVKPKRPSGGARVAAQAQHTAGQR